MDRGFQESLVHFGGGISQPSDPEFYTRKDTYFDTMLLHNGTLEKASGYCSDVFTDAALRFVTEKRDTPFFAYLAFNAPHTPLQVPEADAAPYLAAGLDPQLARLYGMLTNMDRNIGRMLRGLEESGLARDTLVIFMSDNGAQQLGKTERFNAGLRDWKGSAYDGGIRVPFWVRWPAALTAGLETDRIGAPIDILPTLLDACGISREGMPAFDGISLLPVMRDTAAVKSWPDRTLFFQWHRGDTPQPYKNCAVRTQRWKLVNGAELYDMIADPGEKQDLAAQQPDVVQQLRSDYERWFADVGSTRGYGPVRAHVGSDRQNPVTFSRQEWRGEENWSSEQSAGYWEINVERSGDYSATVDFAPVQTRATLHIRVGGAESALPLEPGALSAKMEGLRPVQGDTRLECWVETKSEKQGARFVTLTRNSG
jgi:arylsulfatase A-like enzyme